MNKKDDLLLQAHDLSPGLKEYYDSIAAQYDLLRKEVKLLNKNIKSSIKPLFVAVDIINFEGKIKKLSTQMRKMSRQLDQLIEEKNPKTPVPLPDPIFIKREIDRNSHSVRLYNSLVWLGCSTYGEVLDRGERALWDHGYMNEKIMKELKDFLRENGLILKNP